MILEDVQGYLRKIFKKGVNYDELALSITSLIEKNFGKKVEFTVNMDGNYLSCSVLQTISLFDIIMVSLRFSLRKSRNVRRRSRPRFPRGMT